MQLHEILEEISEKYPHGLSNDSVIRKINQVQNELFRTTWRIRSMAIFNLQTNVFAYKLPFPQTSLLSVVINGMEYMYQDSKHKSNIPFYYFIGTDGLGIYPTPTEDIENGISMFYYITPTQLSTADLSATPELDADFHMLLVYGALVQICEAFNDVAMVNNYTAKYNGILEEFHKANDETPDYMVIEDAFGGLL
ncbi:phage adaptor protein [Paenibacillus massiliensis]|uniref:phage adaptor protein n=1 Tax=Paenibacillus massiliensis TaxID=225917 RepID=UPI00041758D7|nr:hypothetical protein [Paenibacillus massiliensis]